MPNLRQFTPVVTRLLAVEVAGLPLRLLLPALVSGLLLAMAGPPLDLWPLALVGLIPLYLVIRDAPPRQAFRLGWSMGFTGLALATYWWVPLLMRWAHLFPTTAMLGALLFWSYQALVFALWAGAGRFLVRRYHLSWLLVGPLLLIILESAWPFIFKWHLAVTVWRAWPLIQVAEVGGAAAVSALIVLVNLTLAEGVLTVNSQRPAVNSQQRRTSDARRLTSPRSIGAAAALVLLLVGGGWLRAVQVTAAREAAPSLRVGLVQPNFGIVPVETRRLRGDDYIRALRQATAEAAGRGAELVVWPESSWPYPFDRLLEQEYPPGHPWELRPGVDGRLLFGTLTHEFGGTAVYNSAVLVNEAGTVTGRYDKNYPMPLSEVIFLDEAFPAWGRWAREARNQRTNWPEITPGVEANLLVDGNLRIALVICSEELEAQLVHAIARQGANLLVAIINDAWFDDSAASRQQMALAAFRAVETRRDLARSTNTGVTSIIDASGRVQLAGPLLAVRPEAPQPAQVFVGWVALLELPALGPYTARFFPYLCLLLLLGVVTGSWWRRGLR